MPNYNLQINVIGQDKGAHDTLVNLTGGLSSLNIALGNLIADGLKAATGALIDFGKSGLNVAMDFQSSMNMFAAVSGATGDQMAAIGAEAKRLGADMTLPATSAGDAAKAMTELAKAGLSVNDALAAGRGTLQLAAAGNIDEAQAAEIAANALNSFGLAGDKAAMVADLFAAAANKSSLEVTDVADGFKMASAVFSAFQGPVVGSEKALKDLTTAMALLGNVGIKGSDAGTSLKQMLLQLTGPSSVAKEQMKGLMFAAMGASGGMEQLDKLIGGKAKDRKEALQALGAANPDIAAMGDIAYDASGKMRPLEEIIKLVGLATKDMADEQRNQALTSIFGADATRAIIGLMRAGPEAFAAMETSISQQGAAADLAGARMKGLGGAWEGFKSTLETTQLSVMEPFLGPLEGWVRGAADALAAATPALTTFVTTGVIPAVTAFAGFMSALIQAPDKLAFLLPGLNSARSVLGEMQPYIAGARDLFNQLVGSLAPLTAAFGQEGLSGAVRVALNSFGELRLGLIGKLQEALPGALTWIGTELTRWAPIIATELGETAIEFVKWIGPATGRLIVALGGLAGALFKWIFDNRSEIGTKLLDWNLAFINWVANDLTPALLSSLGGLGKTVWDELVKLWGAAFAEGSLGKSLVDGLIKGMGEAWGKLTQWFSENWTKLLGAIPGMAPIMAAVNGASLAGVPGFASGVRNFGGGLALVGERGPELLNLPGGSDVIPSGATRGLLGGGTSISVGQIVITGSNDPAATARAVREELIKMGKRNLNIFGGYA